MINMSVLYQSFLWTNENISARCLHDLICGYAGGRGVGIVCWHPLRFVCYCSVFLADTGCCATAKQFIFKNKQATGVKGNSEHQPLSCDHPRLYCLWIARRDGITSRCHHIGPHAPVTGTKKKKKMAAPLEAQTKSVCCSTIRRGKLNSTI